MSTCNRLDLQTNTRISTGYAAQESSWSLLESTCRDSQKILQNVSGACWWVATTVDWGRQTKQQNEASRRESRDVRWPNCVVYDVHWVKVGSECGFPCGISNTYFSSGQVFLVWWNHCPSLQVSTTKSKRPMVPSNMFTCKLLQCVLHLCIRRNYGAASATPETWMCVSDPLKLQCNVAGFISMTSISNTYFSSGHVFLVWWNHCPSLEVRTKSKRPVVPSNMFTCTRMFLHLCIRRNYGSSAAPETWMCVSTETAMQCRGIYSISMALRDCLWCRLKVL